ncbi:MAG: nitrogenase [Firmicutes bacterium]|nr:nitrogenase [Bacillota bacterium]
MAINLNTAVVESREQRLGTIIAWDGAAADLSKESAYARGGCGAGCGGRRLCELSSSFTQGSVCSEQMVECQAGNVREAVLIQHSPIGCGAGQVIYNSIYRNGLALRKLPVENLHLISTNLQEQDMIFGGG